MFKTARIAAVLAFAFACVPAHALSMKDYEAKSDADKLRYLQTCVGNLIIDVAKTDRPLSLKIRSYYYDKLPGYPYPEGTYDLLERIGKLEQQADKDKSVDLSKIRIEELVALTTAAKFKILPDFQRQADPPVTTRPAAPIPAPRPAAPFDDDPIGPGGFITPPDSPQKLADDPIGPGGFITPPTVYKVSAFDPRWQGRTMIVEGTISRVVLDHASYVNIYFRESPDGSFTGYSPLPGLFLERYGRDFSALIGRTVQIEGEVQPFRGTKGSIRILDLKQMKVR
jgi:hypothetical protein